jgi:hypothetical protein
MTEKLTRQQMIDRLRASDPFADEAQFGQIDLSGCPSFFEAELAEKENKRDPFDQKNDYLEINKSGLRNFIESAGSDDSVIEEAARMPGASPDLKAELADRRANDVAVKFKRATNGRYVSTDSNMELLVESLAESELGYSNMPVDDLVTRLQSRGVWTVQNLLDVFDELFSSGEMPDYPRGVYRPLRAEDWEQIARLAQAGQVLPALTFGLQKALDLPNTSTLVIENILVDPSLRGLVNGLTLFIFQAGTPDFDDRDKTTFQEFLSDFAGSRPWNLPIITEAWKSFQAEKRGVLQDRAESPNQSEEQGFEPQDFDRLSDTELEALRVAVLRERSKTR